MTTKQSKITNKLEDNAKVARVGMRRRMTDSEKTLDFFLLQVAKSIQKITTLDKNLPKE